MKKATIEDSQRRINERLAASVPAGSESPVRGDDHARLVSYLRRTIANAHDDSLERATSAFRGLTAVQMQEQHGQSGCTRQELLDGYRAARAEHDQAAAYFEELVTASMRTSHPNPASQPNSTADLPALSVERLKQRVTESRNTKES